MQLDDREQRLLKALVAQYIADGQPVGSQVLARISGLALSASTIRNIMAELEKMGLVTSPHTSAGRVPTPRGYRFFVDTLLSVERIDQEILERLMMKNLSPYSSRKMMAHAAQVLSSFSKFAGVVLMPRRSFIFEHIEFLRISKKRILLVIISPSGDVHNRLLLTEVDYLPAQLVQASNYLNAHYAGLHLEEVSARLCDELCQLRDDMARLMQAAVTASSDAISDNSEEVVIAGERNLLGVHELSSNMTTLRELFTLFEQKTALMQLLALSAQAAGVQIFIGGESEQLPLHEMSIVTAPYHVNGKIVGTLGVIGPTRMAYDRMIPMVDMTAKLLSESLSQYERSG